MPHAGYKRPETAQIKESAFTLFSMYTLPDLLSEVLFLFYEFYCYLFLFTLLIKSLICFIISGQLKFVRLLLGVC